MKKEPTPAELEDRARQWHARHKKQDRYPYRWASVCQSCEDEAKKMPQRSRVADPMSLRQRNDLVLARDLIDSALAASDPLDRREQARAAILYLGSVAESGEPRTIDQDDEEPDRRTLWTNTVIAECHGDPLHYAEEMNAWTWGRNAVGFPWDDPNIQTLLPVTEVQP